MCEILKALSGSWCYGVFGHAVWYIYTNASEELVVFQGTLFRNVGTHLPNYTASHPQRI